MRWQLNTKIKALSDKENNLLRNENWGVCQNITKFMSGVDGCKGSGDVAKCESSLTTVNEAFNSASDLLSFMNNRRKNLYTEERTLRSFASDELKYFQEAQERVKAIHQELQDWESFDESDAVRLSLNRNKWDRFSEVCDVKDSGGSDPKRDKDDMWTFTPDSIINVSTGRSRYDSYHY